MLHTVCCVLSWCSGKTVLFALLWQPFSSGEIDFCCSFFLQQLQREADSLQKPVYAKPVVIKLQIMAWSLHGLITALL